MKAAFQLVHRIQNRPDKGKPNAVHSYHRKQGKDLHNMYRNWYSNEPVIVGEDGAPIAHVISRIGFH